MRIQDEHMTNTTITSPSQQEEQGEVSFPPHVRQMSTTIPSQPSHGRQILRFLLHFGEMVLAMMLGMGIFNVLNNAILIPMGFAYLSIRLFPEAYMLAMVVAMTVPMVAWMRIRKHTWRLSTEMGGGDDSSHRLADYRLLDRSPSKHGLHYGNAHPHDARHARCHALSLGRLYLPLTRERGCQKQQNVAGTTDAHAQLFSLSIFVMFLLAIETGREAFCARV